MGNLDEMLDMPILKDDMEAEEHLAKIAYWQRYEKKWEEYYKSQFKQVQETVRDKIAYHRRLLEDYFVRVPHVKAKTMESYPLPSGKLILKKESEKLVRPEKDDEKMFLLYLAEQGIKEYTKTKVVQELDWREYKKRLQIVDGKAVDKETGEVIDDIKVEKVPADFGWTLNADEEAMNDGAENSVA